MSITAAQVKELRERTGSGMMECKNALVETDGVLNEAIEYLRKTGLAKADKKAGRIAAEGRIIICVDEASKNAAIVEINCETDFVAKDSHFEKFSLDIGQRILDARPTDMNALLDETVSGNDATTIIDATTINEARQNLVAKLGENINVRRFDVLNAKQGDIYSYLHGMRIGVVVELQGGDTTVAKDIAMHIAASNPVCISEDQIPKDLVAKEKEIFTAQAAASGKPDHIVEKMVEGRIKKFFREVALLGQPFVKNPDLTVQQVLTDAKAQINQFYRFELGDGIEKKTENFADEVMSQIKGN